MKARILLRIAAFLLTVHLLGHSVGHSTWDNPEDDKMMEVVTSMKGHQADFMGSSRSMADYYNGYSWMIFGVFGMMIWLLWVVSRSGEEHQSVVVKVLYPVGIACAAFAVTEFIFFFPFAACLSLLSGALTLFTASRMNWK